VASARIARLFGHEAQRLVALDPPDEPVGPGFRRDVVLQEEAVI
jgi:hypothetical protein